MDAPTTLPDGWDDAVRFVVSIYGDDLPLRPPKWIDTGCDDGPDLLIGHGGTFVSRMAAYCPHDRLKYDVSLSEIHDLTPESRAWVDGFLAGVCPGFEQLFGPEDEDDWSDEQVQVFRAAMAGLRRTGEWPWPLWFELPHLESTEDAPAQVWTTSGRDLCWWRDGRWTRVPLPTPDADDARQEATICWAEGEDHEGEDFQGHWLCRRCGLLQVLG